ncbi:MAG: carboxypeptidase-like regulatory domain-containing protein [Balneolaceae bacterium]
MNISCGDFKYRLLVLMAVLFFGMIPGASFAQKGTLHGHVFDEENGDPLPYATISVEGTSTGTISDENGAYSIQLTSGSKLIRYHFLSFTDTLITVEIKPNQQTKNDVFLKADTLQLNEVTVNADRVTQKVQELAEIRNKQNKNLDSYQADIYKLAILSSVNSDFSVEDSLDQDFTPMAFSERKSTFYYLASPERFSERVEANRASKNFFSEYDFFSTGGGPINLNQDEISLSVLSESITVVGPVSSRAGKFYDFYDTEADSSWPEGTIEIYFKPLKENRPLFEGKVWYNEERILGIDVSLNDYANTNTGTFEVSDFRYRQKYEKVDEFWLPEKTELFAVISFLGAKNDILYHDEWIWSNYKLNSGDFNEVEMKLSSSVILPDAHQKNNGYWKALSGKSENENLEHLQQARDYQEERTSVQLGMSVMRSLFRLPYQLERSHLTNISDLYHYTRVEGHYLGLGLRTPVHADFDYRLVGGYAFGNQTYSYQVSGYHFFRNSFVAPEFIFRKETVPQYQDYEYNRTPIDFFEARQTLNALIFGSGGSNYFERQGVEAGLRFRFDTQSFLRVLYVDEKQQSLTPATHFNILGNEIHPENYINNDPVYPAEDGHVKGFNLHLHHDTRQYSRNQFLRDYNIRQFGWLSDVVLEKGVSEWGSDFNYNRYRVGLKFYWPVFTSHFFQTDITFGASDEGVPNQRLFNYNGFVVDDYVRYRPFNTISYREPLGNRVSEIMIRYKLGTSLTRKAPFDFVSKSGIKISTFFTVGVIDETPSLEPLLPYSGSHTQAEMGISASKIFGFFYAEFSKRIYGKFGNSIGFTARF